MTRLLMVSSLSARGASCSRITVEMLWRTRNARIELRPTQIGSSRGSRSSWSTQGYLAANMRHSSTTSHTQSSKRRLSTKGDSASPEEGQGLSIAGRMFFGSLCAGTFALGCWQVQRLVEKQTLVQKRQDELTMEPTTNVATTDFRRVSLSGVYQYDGEFLVGPRGPPPGALPDKPGSSASGMSSAPQGYFVVTPLVLSNEQHGETKVKTVLVNRGWVPRRMAASSAGNGPASAAPRQVQSPRRQAPIPSTSTSTWNRPSGNVNVIAIPAQPEGKSLLIASQRRAAAFASL